MDAPGPRSTPAPGWSAAEAGIAVLLVAAVAAVFAPALGFPFVSWDDPMYVTENPRVREGLGLESLRWAFTSPLGANWHPLTGLSHLLDVELFGLDPAGHHATSVLLHGLATLLLFRLLRAFPLGLGASAWVAALFALHPLHVEPVAWVAGRKDPLSTCFGLLALRAWLHYARQPSARAYVWSALWLALGLMAKPMLVTLPLVFLLLDYWPLARLGTGRRVLLEKIPLLALSAVAGGLTLLMQRGAGAMEPAAGVELPLRLANAAVSLPRYVAKALWPTQLSILYPHPNLPGGTPWADGQVVAAVSGIVLVGLLLWRLRRFGYLAVGALWFGVMLLPVLGLLQVGSQAMADRYTYLPLVGLCFALAAGVSELVARDGRFALRAGVAGLGAASLLACAWASAAQLQVWRSSRTLYEHALAVAPEPPVLHVNLGKVLVAEGRVEEALPHYARALALDPDYALAHANLGNALLAQGRYPEAVQHLQRSLELEPDYAPAYNNLGKALQGLGRLAAAVAVYRQALLVAPDYALVHDNLGNALLAQGRVEEALGHYARALELEPGRATAHNNLGVALEALGRLPEAIAHYAEALRLQPDFGQAHRNLGIALTSAGRLREARSHFEAAARLGLAPP